jgi:MFS family permease
MLVASLLLGPSHLRLLTLLLFFCGCVVALVAASCGGLMATKLYTSAQSKAAGWNQARNFGGGVLGAALVLRLVEHLSLSAVGLATAALVLLPALVAFTVPEAPPTPSRWFRGRFTEIRREARCCGRRSGGGESSFSFTSVASKTMRSQEGQITTAIPI